MKKTLAKLWGAFVAAVTSPNAVRLERSWLAFVAVRLLLAVGATDGIVQLVQKLLG